MSTISPNDIAESNEKFQTFIKEGGNPNAKLQPSSMCCFAEPQPLLYFAMEANKVESVKLLVDSGADLESTSILPYPHMSSMSPKLTPLQYYESAKSRISEEMGDLLVRKSKEETTQGCCRASPPSPDVKGKSEEGCITCGCGGAPAVAAPVAESMDERSTKKDGKSKAKDEANDAPETPKQEEIIYGCIPAHFSCSLDGAIDPDYIPIEPPKPPPKTHFGLKRCCERNSRFCVNLFFITCNCLCQNINKDFTCCEGVKVNQYMKLPNGGMYRGPVDADFNANMVSGTITWERGDFKGRIYEGEVNNNMMDGKGKFTWPSGETFEGLFSRDNFKDCTCVMTWPSGEKFEGDWKDGARNGQGTYTWLNENVYKGSWRNNARTGQGVLTIHGGGVYDGEFEDGYRHGIGKFTDAKGAVSEGHWRRDVYVGAEDPGENWLAKLLD